MKAPQTRAEKIAANKLDARVTRLYGERCSGIQIGIMEISKVFDAGKKAAAQFGDDDKAVGDAIYNFVQTIRHN